MTNCCICEAAAKAASEGRRGFSVSTHGKALCAEHWNEIRLERAS